MYCLKELIFIPIKYIYYLSHKDFLAFIFIIIFDILVGFKFIIIFIELCYPILFVYIEFFDFNNNIIRIKFIIALKINHI